MELNDCQVNIGGAQKLSAFDQSHSERLFYCN